MKESMLANKDHPAVAGMDEDIRAAEAELAKLEKKPPSLEVQIAAVESGLTTRKDQLAGWKASAVKGANEAKQRAEAMAGCVSHIAAFLHRLGEWMQESEEELRVAHEAKAGEREEYEILDAMNAALKQAPVEQKEAM